MYLVQSGPRAVKCLSFFPFYSLLSIVPFPIHFCMFRLCASRNIAQRTNQSTIIPNFQYVYTYTGILQRRNTQLNNFTIQSAAHFHKIFSIYFVRAWACCFCMCVSMSLWIFVSILQLNSVCVCAYEMIKIKAFFFIYFCIF